MTKGTKAPRHEGAKKRATQPRSHAAKKRRSDEATAGKRAIPRAIIVMVTVLGLLTPACVRRTINITTEPPNARVFLNDQEVGRSAVTTDFLWYGDYGVTIRKEGFETLETNWVIKPPWYQRIPLDFFTEVLWPGQLHDTHSRHFILEPAKIPTQEELIGRAGETRDRALDARK
jgi:PEGA domain